MEVLRQIAQTNWMPRSGPITTTQQIIVALYLVVAVLCIFSAWQTKRKGPYTRFDVGFWSSMGLILAGLAFNRAFGVHIAITDFMRMVARSGYWYGTRRSVQEPVIIGMLILGAILFLLLRWLAKPIWERYKLAAFGAAGLVTLIGVRTVSWHYMDTLLYQRTLGLFMHQVIEISCIGIAAVAALFQLRRQSLLQ